MHDKYLNSEAISPRNNRMSLSEVAFDMEMDDDFEEGATCTLHSVWTEREAREALDGSHWECRRSEDHVQLSDEASASARPPARLSAESTKSSHHGQQPSYECVVHALFDFEQQAQAPRADFRCGSPHESMAWHISDLSAIA